MNIFKTFEFGQVNFSAYWEITYQKCGEEFTITKSNNDIMAEPLIQSNDDGLLTCKLLVENTSEYDVFIKTIKPVCTDNLSMGMPVSNWHVMKQGRHKNDLPVVCKLDKTDESFSDAIHALSEHGNYIVGENNGKISFVSDQITLIHTDISDIAIEFLTADRCMVACVFDLDKDFSKVGFSLCCEVNCILKSGKTLESELIGFDSKNRGFAAVKEFSRRLATEKKIVKKEVPSVYSTWYYYGMDITPQNIYENLDALSESELPITCFQLDDGWEAAYGNWEPNLKFPDGMKQIADRIKEKGYIAGIWTCPFTISQKAPVAQEHPEWMLKNKKGGYCNFKANNKDNFILDLTNPEVLPYLQEIYKKLTFEWGYTYHKLDFTRCAVIAEDADFFDKTITPVEAYKRAMLTIKRSIGDDSYLLVCGGLYDPLIGIADGQRTGTDVLSVWTRNGTPLIPFTVNQNILRCFMNDWWHNDPDSLMIRRNTKVLSDNYLALGTLSDEEVKTFTANQYFGGGLFGFSERLSVIDEDRLRQLVHILPIVKTEISPASLFTGGRFISDIDVYVKEKAYHTICHINWSENSEKLMFTTDFDFMDQDKKYVVSEFYSGKHYDNVTKGSTLDFGEIQKHSTAIFKIEEAGKPVIINSTAHFSLGGEVDVCEIVGNQLHFKMDYKFAFPSEYTILVNNKIIKIVVDKKGSFEKFINIL